MRFLNEFSFYNGSIDTIASCEIAVTREIEKSQYPGIGTHVLTSTVKLARERERGSLKLFLERGYFYGWHAPQASGPIRFLSGDVWRLIFCVTLRVGIEKN